jgi:hypothetical protein
MKRLLPLLFCLLLAGCQWSQKQQFDACASEATRHTAREDSAARLTLTSNYVEACMRAHGYELNQAQCPRVLREDSIQRLDPAALATLSEELRRAYTEGIEKSLAAMAPWRKAEPTCYEPMGWFGKRVLWIEKWLGTSVKSIFVKSKEAAQIELIECAGFQSAMHQSGLWGPVYDELKRRGTQPVDIQAIPALANAYANTYTVTHGRGAEVSARWDKGVTTGKKLVEKRDVAGIARYLKSCVGTFHDALRD